MPESVNICIFDGSGANDSSFSRPFGMLPNVHIAGQATTWEELRDFIRRAEINLVAINLDDARSQPLKIVGHIAELAPSCGIIGVSAQTDPTTIIAAMRAGCSQFVPWPVDTEDLRQAVERIRSTRQAVAHASNRICVLGSSGGVGATTIACNLAMELAHLVKRSIALVDLNLEFGDVACAFDCEPRFTIADVCRSGVEVDRLLLNNAVHQLPCQVSVLARPTKVEEAGEICPGNVENMLAVMSEMYPYVVVDLGRVFNAVTGAALQHADRLLIVAQLNVPSIRNANRMYKFLLQSGADEDRVEIVLNRYKANYERITHDEVESHFGREIYALIPNDYRHIQTAVDLGHPVMADAPTSPARLAIREIAKKLAGGDVVEDAKVPAASGTSIFSKLWRRGNREE